MQKYKDCSEVGTAKEGKKRETERISAIAGCIGLQ